MKLVATDFTVVVLNDTGHWILEKDRRKQPTRWLSFFDCQDRAEA